jgi:hypothetical protein
MDTPVVRTADGDSVIDEAIPSEERSRFGELIPEEKEEEAVSASIEQQQPQQP